jgi:uncharacterized membrane protein
VTTTVDRELWTALVSHAALSVGLVYAPLLVATRHGPPGEPLFGGLAGVVAPLYYLCVFVVIVAPAVQSARRPPAPDATDDLGETAVDDLKRRYVEEEVSETELERGLERLLEE